MERGGNQVPQPESAKESQVTKMAGLFRERHLGEGSCPKFREGAGYASQEDLVTGRA